MPAPIHKNAWGFTINYCEQVGQNTNTTTAKTAKTKPSNPTSNTTATPTENTSSDNTNFSPLENLQNQKVGLENKINSIDKKLIRKKPIEQST